MYIYNETKLPYVYEEGAKKTNVLSRIVSLKKEDNKIIKKRSHILVHDSIKTEKFVSNIKKAVSTKYPVCVSDNKEILYFSKKELVPFVTSLGENECKTLLATIKMFGADGTRRKLVDIKHPFIYLLKGHLFKGELTVIASFTDESKDLRIRLIEGDKLVTYVFKLVNGKIKLNVKEQQNTEGVQPAQKVSIKNYVPSRLTYLVLAFDEAADVIENGEFKNKHGRHSVIKTTSKTLSKTLDEIVAQQYKAITLFVNESEFNDEVSKQASMLLTMPQAKELKNVLIAYNTGKVERLRSVE